MLKVKAGNLDKLGLLFERYNQKLFSYFFRLTCRRDVSEDLVQSVFERIIKYRHTYDSSHAFSTWIYRIAHNLHADHYRKNKQAQQHDTAFDFDNLKIADNESNDSITDDRELQLLQQALAKLDPVKKQTLLLSRFQGFKYKEIAAIMDCTESAVKVRIFRALNDLKRITAELKNQNDYE